MMKKNYRHERYKHIRREYERYDEMWKDRNEYISVPLEQPQFAGWEVWIDLKDDMKHHPEAPLWLKLIEIMGWRKPLFIRSIVDITFLRSKRYDYLSCANIKRKRWYRFDKFYNRGINDYEYKKVPEKYQKYFEKSYHMYQVRWILRPVFSFKHLTFRHAKVYWKALNHPNGDKIGEMQKLRDKLYNGSYSPDLPSAFEWDWNYRRDDFTAGLKTGWRTATHMLKTQYNMGELDYEAEEEILIKTKVLNKKNYGWS